jgi:hypothetical protein
MLLITLAIIHLSQSTSIENLDVGSTSQPLPHIHRVDESSEDRDQGAASDLATYIALRKSAESSAEVKTPVGSPGGFDAASVAAVDEICTEDNSKWLIDYYILREGHDFSKELRNKLDWMCSIDVDDMTDRFSEERMYILSLFRSLEDNLVDLVYGSDDLIPLLDIENVHKVKGGLIHRHEAIESLNQAMDILRNTKASQPEPEIALRRSIAMHIATHAQEYEARFDWVSEYCYDDRKPLSLFLDSRFAGADFGSSMEFFKTLDGLQIFEPPAAPIVDELTSYIYSRRIKIRKYWEAVDALTVLFQAVEQFIIYRSTRGELMASLQKSLEYLVKYEDAIFM